jgi:quercetin dioxygenase-like cupin family protein
VPKDPTYYAVDQLEWADDTASGLIPAEMLAEAQRRGGGGRKFLADGKDGFYSTYSVVPPGYIMPPHRHDTDELLVVLDGACTWLDGHESMVHDSVTIPAGLSHGYTVGASGMKLMTISRAPFKTELLEAGNDP